MGVFIECIFVVFPRGMEDLLGDWLISSCSLVKNIINFQGCSKPWKMMATRGRFLHFISEIAQITLPCTLGVESDNDFGSNLRFCTSNFYPDVPCITILDVYVYIYIYYIYIHYILYIIWVNYNDLTATSLESWLVREIIPKWP